MPRRLEVMAVDTGDTIAVYPVKRAKLAHPRAATQKTFLCLHCNQHSALPWFEVTQHGFFVDKYQEICYCNFCLNLSVYEFEVEVSNETS